MNKSLIRITLFHFMMQCAGFLPHAPRSPHYPSSPRSATRGASIKAVILSHDHYDHLDWGVDANKVREHD